MKVHSLFLCLGVLVSSSTVVASNSVEKQVDQKVAQEKPATRPGELATRGFEAWASSSNIDLDQKSKLWAIQAATGRDAIRIRNEITMTKSALFKELAKGDYSTKLVDGFKTKIVKLDRERLEIMFAALDKVEETLGKGPHSREYYRYLEKMETHGFDGR